MSPTTLPVRVVAVISPTVMSGVAVSPYARAERTDDDAVPTRLPVTIPTTSPVSCPWNRLPEISTGS